MGQIPIATANNPIAFNPQVDQFQSKHLQRIKSTPFKNSQVYCLNPPIHVDPMGLRLTQLIQPRMNSRQLFPISQIYGIIKSIGSALNDLQQHTFKCHGDVSTESVYYCRNSKTFKLKHPKLCQSGYNLAKAGKRFSILAPQQLLTLTADKEANQDHTTFGSDIFILGLVVCEMATIVPANQVFCPDTYKIFDEEIQNRLMIIQQYYNPDLKNIVSKMLTYQRQNRITPQQLSILAKKHIEVHPQQNNNNNTGSVHPLRTSFSNKQKKQTQNVDMANKQGNYPIYQTRYI